MAISRKDVSCTLNKIHGTSGPPGASQIPVLRVQRFPLCSAFKCLISWPTRTRDMPKDIVCRVKLMECNDSNELTISCGMRHDLHEVLVIAL